MQCVDRAFAHGFKCIFAHRRQESRNFAQYFASDLCVCVCKERNTSRKEWKCAVLTLDEDMKADKMPCTRNNDDTNRFLSFTVLHWVYRYHTHQQQQLDIFDPVCLCFLLPFHWANHISLCVISRSRNILWMWVNVCVCVDALLAVRRMFYHDIESRRNIVTAHGKSSKEFWKYVYI